MRMVDLIQKKRDGHTHADAEIYFIIQNYSQGLIPDEQMAAWAMAVYFQGMTDSEMAALTLAMAASGEQLDWQETGLSVVDKHSTGGVGDKTTLFVAPWAVACGLRMGKMSGRGLGHTGGTLDKLESIPGFSVDLSPDAFVNQVKAIGLALIGQNPKMTPADKKLYALRDVTGTVPSIPLIASSIMSKKIAAGADVIVLDVKVGSGAFMKDLDAAIALAKAMVAIGEQVGRKTVALITNMNEPLGYAIGNANEVREAMRVLSGSGPRDLAQLGLELVSTLLIATGKAKTEDDAKDIAKEALDSGAAMYVFRAWIAAQGGDLTGFDDLDPWNPKIVAPMSVNVISDQEGYVSHMESEAIGFSAMRLGAGRAVKSDVINHRAGIELKAKVGDWVQKGQILATLYSNQLVSIDRERSVIKQAIQISSEKPEKSLILIAKVDCDGVHVYN